MAEDLTRKMLAAAAWERAKGALRELVAIQGHRRLTDPGRTRDAEAAAAERWELLAGRVDAFIAVVEADGLQE